MRVPSADSLTVVELVGEYCDAATRRRLVLLESSRMAHAFLRILPLSATFSLRRVWRCWIAEVRARRRARPYNVSFRRRLHAMDDPVVGLFWYDP